ncbi:MAG: dipeptide ABC transporter ATP-binding protein [Flexilinea sp.]|nr:dipeptide ABC transporter ATP-binding protein [Flexilinea sp.]
MDSKEILLSVRDLTKFFPVRSGLFLKKASSFVHAVDGVSFDIRKGGTLGLVGESGCGKSTTGRATLQLQKPDSGSVLFDGKELTGLRGKELRAVRKDMQMIFQDPYASLNPRMTVGQIVEEPMVIHQNYRGAARKERVKELLRMVGLNPAFTDRYPHEFSGGQRQRIGIARALAPEPKLIVCDEPISALDVSIQAQVVNLLEDLQHDMGLTYLFIAHDLSMVRHISDRIAVMYLGVIVELADRNELYKHPVHPYTRALLSAVPLPDPEIEEKRRRIILPGDVPSPVDPPGGCRFRTRCRFAKEVCAAERPPFSEIAPGHFSACHFSTDTQ